MANILKNNKGYGVVRLDKTMDLVGHSYSGQYEEELENGSLVSIGDLIEDDKFSFGANREVYEILEPKAKEGVFLVKAPEVMYDESGGRAGKSLTKFINVANKPMRLIQLQRQDIVSFSKLEGDADEKDLVGKYVTVEDGEFTPVVVDEEPTDNGFYGKIIGVDTIGTTTVIGQAGVKGRPITFVAVRIIKNEIK